MQHGACYTVMAITLDCLGVCGCLQEEVNWVTGPKPYLESMSGEGSGEEQADESWQYCRSRCNSPIQELFTGQLQTRTTCSSCGHRSLHFDEFQTLSLKFPHNEPGRHELGLTLQVNAALNLKSESESGSYSVPLHTYSNVPA